MHCTHIWSYDPHIILFYLHQGFGLRVEYRLGAWRELSFELGLGLDIMVMVRGELRFKLLWPAQHTGTGTGTGRMRARFQVRGKVYSGLHSIRRALGPPTSASLPVSVGG